MAQRVQNVALRFRIFALSQQINQKHFQIVKLLQFLQNLALLRDIQTYQ